MDDITQETIKHVLFTVQNIEGLMRDPSGAGLWCTGPIPYKNWPLCSHGQEKAHYVLAPNMDIEKKVEEPVKVRVERNKSLEKEQWDSQDSVQLRKLMGEQVYQQNPILEQEIGLSAQPRGMENPTMGQYSAVEMESMPLVTQLSSQSVQPGTNQYRVEQALKCAHKWTSLYLKDWGWYSKCQVCPAYRLDGKILVRVVEDTN